MISGKGISEFIPPRSGVLGYLDFDGNFFVDMQVRQRGNRVASPPHSYKVRGKWEEPKIIIK